jgi:acyl-CoA thioester hydrolase
VHEPYRYVADVRYFESDAQGVVFNMWYLGYLDEAMTGYLEHVGLSYGELSDDGLDFQLVRTEVDWADSLRFGDRYEVAVRTEALGRTSVTLSFDVSADGRAVAKARTVYVVVGTDGSGARELTDRIRLALSLG